MSRIGYSLQENMVKVYDFLKNAYVPDGHEALSDFLTGFEVAEGPMRGKWDQ